MAVGGGVAAGRPAGVRGGGGQTETPEAAGRFVGKGPARLFSLKNRAIVTLSRNVLLVTPDRLYTLGPGTTRLIAALRVRA